MPSAQPRAQNRRATQALSDERRWSAVVQRDPLADGTFWYAVETTGIFCYPSCASRRARREHVTFYDTAEAAQRAGFRPCARCKSDQPPPRVRVAELVMRLCRFIAEHPGEPSLSELADHVGLKPSQTQRLFKRATGVTPHAYAAELRVARTREGLRDKNSVTRVIFDAGYASASRFYDAADSALGMTPTQYRRGGEELVIEYGFAKCSLGSVLVAITSRGICAIEIADSNVELERLLAQRFPRARLTRAPRRLSGLIARAVSGVAGSAPSGDLPLDVRGTAFQRRVWQALKDIPPGETRTYSELAAAIERPGAVRAVASACAANAHAVLIPCHRVLRKDCSIGGYRWGKERKCWLLARESAAAKESRRNESAADE